MSLFLQSEIVIPLLTCPPRISEDYFLEKSGEWRKEREELRQAIKGHEKANVSHLTHGISILGLARKAYRLYLKQKPTEKRKLLIISAILKYVFFRSHL